MEDVLATYEKPYTAAEPVVCLDEKPVTLHADIRPPIPAAPGRTAKRDNEYKRCGTANVFCAVEPKAGRHFTLPTPNRSAPEFAQALETVVDPELGLNVVELSLIREIVLTPGSTEIRMILTTPFCPYAGAMIAEVKAAVETVVEHPVKVTLLAEAWDPREAGLIW